MKKLKKIDMHVHCIEERGIPKLSGHFYPTVHELRKIYDEIGVEKGVLLPPGTCPEFTTERLSPREAEAIAKNTTTQSDGGSAELTQDSEVTTTKQTFHTI